MAHHVFRRVLMVGAMSFLLGAFLFITRPAAAQQDGPPGIDYQIKLDVAVQHLSDKFCWFHPRPTPIFGTGAPGSDVLVTVQKHLEGISDFYSGLWTMRTRDGGQTWEGPTEIAELGWRRDGDVIIGVADVTPGWHQPTQRVIAVGAQIRYNAQGQQLEDIPRAHQTAYAVFDPGTHQWSSWQLFEMPEDAKFNYARSACSQWVVAPDGSVLLPFIYNDAARPYLSTSVVRASFDGGNLTYVEHGNELRLEEGWGLMEPSITHFGGKYYMTIRGSHRNFVTVSDDGLNYAPVIPWKFDDGADLGSYNTQQHWVAHSEGLFVAYCRRGADNDHIFRHRAPLFIAQVDADKLRVIRDTERVLIPERGATMGNFGANAISARESWVTVGEYIAGGKPHPRGADGSVFVARVVWDRPNKLVEEN